MSEVHDREREARVEVYRAAMNRDLLTFDSKFLAAVDELVAAVEARVLADTDCQRPLSNS